MVHSRRQIVSTLIACLLGVAQPYVFLVSWPYVTAYDPVPAQLLELGLRGNTLYVACYLFDLMINTLLAVPVALVLVALRPQKTWFYAGVCFSAALVWLRTVFDASFLWQSLSPLLGIPLSTWAVSFWRSKPAPNNSFKPKPLQGSA